MITSVHTVSDELVCVEYDVNGVCVYWITVFDRQCALDPTLWFCPPSLPPTGGGGLLLAATLVAVAGLVAIWFSKRREHVATRDPS
jgi:hypothetical protein